MLGTTREFSMILGVVLNGVVCTVIVLTPTVDESSVLSLYLYDTDLGSDHRSLVFMTTWKEKLKAILRTWQTRRFLAWI